MTTRDELLAEAGQCGSRARELRSQAINMATGAQAVGSIVIGLGDRVRELCSDELDKLSDGERDTLIGKIERLMVGHARLIEQRSHQAIGEAAALEAQAVRLAELAGPAPRKRSNGKAKPAKRKRATRARARGRS